MAEVTSSNLVGPTNFLRERYDCDAAFRVNRRLRGLPHGAFQRRSITVELVQCQAVFPSGDFGRIVTAPE